MIKFTKITHQTIILKDGNNGEWWFTDDSGIYLEGYFSSPAAAFVWAKSKGFTMTAQPYTLTDMDEMDIAAHALEMSNAKNFWYKELPSYRVDRILKAQETSGTKIELYVADFNALIDFIESKTK